MVVLIWTLIFININLAAMLFDLPKTSVMFFMGGAVISSIIDKFVVWYKNG
jgi:hypothetical protein